MTETRRPLPLIDDARLPHTALRRTETYLRRQTFRVEDTGVRRLQALYRAAYADLLLALDAAGHATPALLPYFAGRISNLRADVLALLDRLTRAARAGGYYGRLWQLDTSTLPDVPVYKPWMNPLASVLSPAAAVLMALEMDDLMVKLRRAVTPSLTASETDVSKAIKTAFGVVAQDGHVSGSFARTSTLARTTVQNAAVAGGQGAYLANAPLMDELEWLTAEDERVCPQCRAWDGKRFPMNTDFRPPLHPNCRCQLVPILRDEYAVSVSTPPREPLEVWSQYNGVTHELTLFLSPKYI